MGIKEARELCSLWAGRLGLVGWRIQVKWGTKRDIEVGMFGEDCDGSCVWSVEHRDAIICLDKRAADLEHTILHELIHVLYEGHMEKPRKYDAHYEYAINKTAEVLIRAYENHLPEAG